MIQRGGGLQGRPWAMPTSWTSTELPLVVHDQGPGQSMSPSCSLFLDSAIATVQLVQLMNGQTDACIDKRKKTDKREQHLMTRSKTVSKAERKRNARLQ